jgi:hypothetical protein
VKLIKAEGEKLVFQIGKREKRILLEVLKFYPITPANFQPLSKDTPATALEENQRLLEEALTEHRRENRKQLDAMLNEPHRFQENEGGYRFTLSVAQMDWLLQVLNDVRVGSWLILGCPDEKRGKPITLTDRNSHYLWAMEMGGYFQYRLLDALNQAA